MSDEDRIGRIKDYFAKTIQVHGATPKGVDWNSQSAADVRFTQLLQVCDLTQPFSIIDFGCGYGALVDYLSDHAPSFEYLGYDICEDMIQRAKSLYADKPNCAFTTQEADLHPVDYVMASGIFNIRFEEGDHGWNEYILSILNKFDQLSLKGFSFNMLTKYSDKHRMRPELYYADPCYYFDYCKTHFSKNVALLHDYQLYDFTILVRKFS